MQKANKVGEVTVDFTGATVLYEVMVDGHTVQWTNNQHEALKAFNESKERGYGPSLWLYKPGDGKRCIERAKPRNVPRTTFADVVVEARHR